MTYLRIFQTSTLIIACLAVTACITTPGQARTAGSCVIQGSGTLGISAELLELAPGESVQLDRPVLFVAPFLPPGTISANCSVRWSATEGGAVDNSGLLTIARDALPGSTVVVRAHVDTLVARQDVRVMDPAPNPLALTARVIEGELIVEGRALAGPRSSSPGCRSVFKRLGGPR